MLFFEFKNEKGKKCKVYLRQVSQEDFGSSKQSDAEGLCTNPDGDNPFIVIDPRLLSCRLLSVALEEMFHHFAYDKNEKTARKFAATTRKLINKLKKQKLI